MYINKLSLKQFGKFNNKDIQLETGINLVKVRNVDLQKVRKHTEDTAGTDMPSRQERRM